MRLVPDAEVRNGKAHAVPRLHALLERLPQEERRRLVRGDCAFGNETVIVEMESLTQVYVVKMSRSPGGKRLIERQWSRHD